jgi:predicted membrane-bound spermidine synthase
VASPPLVAVTLLAAATLGYEVLLTRLFSIVQWHHFAYMMISVAMLGYGAAGTFVALSQRFLCAHFAPVFIAFATAFGVTAVGGFLIAQRIAFNPLELLWDPQQPLRLLAVYALLFVPFFCAATCVCLTFTRFGAEAHRVYACDLGGAGAGCLGILALLFVLTPTQALIIVGVTGGVAAAAAVKPCGLSPRVLPALLFGALLAGVLALVSEWTELRPSAYKELSQTLAVSGMRIVAERSSPLGAITVVESTRIPFRHAPGQSLVSLHEPPPQLAIFTDGDAMSALNRYDGQRASLAYLGDLTSAAPYSLRENPRVLVLGAGTGTDVLQALYHEAAAVDAVELNPQVIDLVENRFAAFSGRPYSVPRVHLHIAEARRFIASGTESYDLITVALLDAFGATAAGLHALSESYLYTVEALDGYLARLAPGGLLAITRWVTLPPRDMLKLVATVAAALERDGVAQPGRQIALIRGWRTATLLVRNGAFTDAEIAALKAFCRARSFDLDYFPGMRPDEANRYNVLDRSWYYDGVVALLGPTRDRFFDQYKFDVVPATDDRPFFFHFFKWRTLPELLALKARGGMPLLEWGYPVLIATLIQAAAAAALLILLPLFFARRPATSRAVGLPRARVAVYFLALGCGFMFIEIAFIQKFILFLGHPLHAVAVVLFAFLIFAGLGSRYAGRRQPGIAPSRTVARPVFAIGLLALVYIALLPQAFAYLMPQSDAVRIGLSVGLIAPLAFAMGMPFPRGVERLAERAPALIAWAWGINACASVVAAILATLLALHLGFDAVVALAVAMYALAAAAGRRLLGDG